MVKNPHFQCRGHGFHPWPGKFRGAAKEERKKRKSILKDSSKVTVGLGLKRTDILSQCGGWKSEIKVSVKLAPSEVLREELPQASLPASWAVPGLPTH